jgi:hypothetical protein
MNEELHYALNLSRQGYTTAAIVEDKEQKRDSLNRILLLTQDESMRTWANEQLALLDQPAPAAPPAPAEPSAPIPSSLEPDEDDWSQMLSELAEEPAPGEMAPSPLSGQTGEERPELGVDEWSQLVQSWGAPQPGGEPSPPEPAAPDEPAEDSWEQMLEEMVEEPEPESAPPAPEPAVLPSESDLDEWASILDEAPTEDDGLTATTAADAPLGADWADLIGGSPAPSPPAEKPKKRRKRRAEPELAPVSSEDDGEWSQFLDGLAEPEEEEAEEDEWAAMLEEMSEEELVEEKPAPVRVAVDESDITPMLPKPDLPSAAEEQPRLEDLMPLVHGDEWDELLVAWGEEPLLSATPVTGETQAAQRTDAIRRSDIDKMLETPPPPLATDDLDTPPLPEAPPELQQVQELESWAGEQPQTFMVEPPPTAKGLTKEEVDAMIAARLQGVDVGEEKEKEEEDERKGGCLRLLLVVAIGLVLGAIIMFGLFWLAQTNPQIAANIPLLGGVLAPSTETADLTLTEVPAETPTEAMQAVEPSPTAELLPSLTPTTVPTQAASITPVTSPSAPPPTISVTPSPVLPTPTAIVYGENIFIPPSTTSLAVQQFDGFDPDFGRVVLLRDNIIIVGGPFEDSAGADGVNYEDAGKVYILQRRGENWASGVDMVALTSPEPEEDQGFGSAIAFDGETLAVGTRNSNVVYVIQLEDNTWETITTPSEGKFGSAIAFDGETLVIGAPEENNSTGAAYIYALEGSDWVEQQELTADNPAEGDRFGQAVAVDGETIAVGALGAGEELPDAPGAVYVYQLEDGTWEQKNG